MSQPARCPRCRAEIGEDGWTHPVCPVCLLESAAVAPDPERGPDHAEAPQRPERIGFYRLFDVIGEGGMGIVYRAEQDEPVRRTVALKILKPGMDTRQVIARFDAERQALALMDHASIARVFDAGETERGRPYFAMEFVHGRSITEHCDRNRLSMRDRIELFVQVCEGVQHAHQKGVIHRDLKPSNVLVSVQDGTVMPKIIDFGIAKATALKLTEKTLFTELGALVGTPEYMSPEQVDLTLRDVDTRSDVYSLGVLLYELLTGALPFDRREMRDGGVEEIRRRIRETEPSKPSTRVRTLGAASKESARNRQTEPGRLASELRGDLDWIVMRALEKDRERRYGSATELADDLRRHLAHEPVIAGPPSATYRTRKFVRRHRVGVSAAGVVAIAMLAGLGAATWGLARARAAEETASVEAETAGQSLEFLIEVFGESDPFKAQGKELTALEVLEAGAARIDEEFSDRPLVRARLMDALGQIYRNLGKLDRAEPMFRGALAVRRDLLGEEHPDALRTMRSLAESLERRGRYDEAEELFVRTLESSRRVFGPSDSVTISAAAGLSWVYYQLDRFEEAEAMCLAVLEDAARTRDEAVQSILYLKGALAAVYHEQRRFAEAESLQIDILEGRRRTLGDDHPHTLTSRGNLGSLYAEMGRYDEALELLTTSLEGRERVLGPDHPGTLFNRHVLGTTYLKVGRFEDAERELALAYQGRQRVLGPEHSLTLATLAYLGRAYERQGRIETAERAYLEARGPTVKALGENHYWSVWMTTLLGELYCSTGRAEKAIELLEPFVESDEQPDGEKTYLKLDLMQALADAYVELDMNADAEAILRRTLAARREVLGAGHPETRATLDALVALYERTGHEDEAVRLREEARDL